MRQYTVHALFAIRDLRISGQRRSAAANIVALVTLQATLGSSRGLGGANVAVGLMDDGAE